MINRLLDAGRDGFEGGLTTRKYVSMARVSQATKKIFIDEIFKWFLASILYGKRISYKIAERTYKEFEKRGILTPEKIIEFFLILIASSQDS